MIKLFKYKKSASSYIKSETADIGLFTSEETISFLIRPAPKYAASLLGHKSSVWRAGKSLYRHEVSLDSAVRFFGARVRWQAVERGKVVLDSVNLVSMREYILNSMIDMRAEFANMKDVGMREFDTKCFNSFEHLLPHVRIFVGDKRLMVNKVGLFTPA